MSALKPVRRSSSLRWSSVGNDSQGAQGRGTCSALGRGGFLEGEVPKGLRTTLLESRSVRKHHSREERC